MIPCWNILLASFCSLFSHFSVKLFNSSCPHQGYHFNVLLWHLWHLGFTCCPPVASSATIMSPSHFHPATIGWSVLNHLLLLHPHIPAAFSHLTGIVPSSTVFWFHFSKTKAYCCPVSRSVCSHFQAGGKVVRQYRNCKKSGPRNSRDDSSLLAFIVLVARFSAVRSNLWFPGRHYQIFTLRKLSLAASLDLEEGAYPGQGLHVWHPHVFFTPIWSSSFSSSSILVKTRHPSQPLWWVVWVHVSNSSHMAPTTTSCPPNHPSQVSPPLLCSRSTLAQRFLVT